MARRFVDRKYGIPEEEILNDSSCARLITARDLISNYKPEDLIRFSHAAYTVSRLATDRTELERYLGYDLTSLWFWEKHERHPNIEDRAEILKKIVCFLEYEITQKMVNHAGETLDAVRNPNRDFLFVATPFHRVILG